MCRSVLLRGSFHADSYRTIDSFNMAVEFKMKSELNKQLSQIYILDPITKHEKLAEHSLMAHLTRPVIENRQVIFFLFFFRGLRPY